MTAKGTTRPLLAEWHRGTTPMPWRRCYARIDTALPKLIYQLLINGQPGDTIQLSLRQYGTWIADVKAHADGMFSIILSE